MPPASPSPDNIDTYYTHPVNSPHIEQTSIETDTTIPDSHHSTQEPTCILVPPSSLTSTTAIPDSGSTEHMTGSQHLFSELHFFEDTNTTPPTVTLGDDKHKISATGWGVMDLLEGSKRIRRIALFVPALGNITLLSIKKHTSYLGCAFHAEANEAILAYPTHLTEVANNKEYTISIQASTDSSVPIDFDETEAQLCKTYATSYNLIQTDLSTYLSQKSINSMTKTVTFTPLSKKEPTPKPSTSSPTTFEIKSPSTTTIPPGFSFTTPLQFNIKCDQNIQTTFTSENENMRVTFLQTLCGTIATICNISDSPLSLDPSTTIGNIQFLHNTSPLRIPHHTTSTHNPKDQWRRGFFQTGDNEFIFHDSPPDSKIQNKNM
jgi:hypothetical protein